MTRADVSFLTANEQTTLGAAGPKLQRVCTIVGGVGLAVAFALGLVRGDGLSYFLHSYLTNYCYFLSISLGALFFVALQHATRAGWSVTVRRLNEILAANILTLGLLFLPIILAVLFGGTSLYEWASKAVVEHDELLQHKSAYLNPWFFIFRALTYFAVWGLLTWFFLRRSLEQDETGDAALTQRMERLSPAALILFGVTITFASFDWLMSLEPRWFSTIYGAYYFSGAAVAGLAAVIVLIIVLQANGRLTSAVTTEHHHDLGKLLFGFVVFWGYIAFSQYLLIWYANIPEESVWYLARQSGPWKWVSLTLLFGHLFIPFFGLLSRQAKRRKAVLGFWSVWLLAIHWVDIYWLVMPSLGAEGLPFGFMDLCGLIGMGGLFLAGALRIAGDRPLVPVADPRLSESLAFENL